MFLFFVFLFGASSELRNFKVGRKGAEQLLKAPAHRHIAARGAVELDLQNASRANLESAGVRPDCVRLGPNERLRRPINRHLLFDIAAAVGGLVVVDGGAAEGILLQDGQNRCDVFLNVALELWHRHLRNADALAEGRGLRLAYELRRNLAITLGRLCREVKGAVVAAREIIDAATLCRVGKGGADCGEPCKASLEMRGRLKRVAVVSIVDSAIEKADCLLKDLAEVFRNNAGN